MGLFIRRPSVQIDAPKYTIGAHKSMLIVGLGNVGKEYEGTRHNIGFAAIDYFAEGQGFPSWSNDKKLKIEKTEMIMNDTKIFLIKPTTYMNLSGEAVVSVMNYYGIASQKVIVIHDELDLPFGSLRMAVNGSSAGHNGLKSIMQHIGEDFGRIRIGIRNVIAEKAEASNFVLGKFTKEEQGNLNDIYKEVESILTETIFSGKLISETRIVL